MAGFFEKLKKRVRDFLIDEVEVDEHGNEKIIESSIDDNSSSRIDVITGNYIEIEDSFEDDLLEKVKSEPLTNERLSEQTVENQKEIKQEEKEIKKHSMFVDLNNMKSIESERKVEEGNEKPKSSYVPQRVISQIFGSDKDSYAISINNLEYDSEKPKRSVIGTVFSPIFGRDRIIEDTIDEVDEKIANMTTSDFISDSIQSEKKEEEINPVFDEEMEAPKPLYTKLTVEEKSTTYVGEKPIDNSTLFDTERVNKALNEAKVAFDEIEKAAKPVENTASYENISLFD
ncbi:MAG: hypothetical protein GX935_01870 [Erysipelotrichia bacterium]|nr:hypothetical protein [Erysipelotrichia bacterium]